MRKLILFYIKNSRSKLIKSIYYNYLLLKEINDKQTLLIHGQQKQIELLNRKIMFLETKVLIKIIDKVK